jgi:uncharacterized protein (TIGR02246 family)
VHSSLRMHVATIVGVVAMAGATGGSVAVAASNVASPVHSSVNIGAPKTRPNPERPPTKRQIAALFDQWNAALATGNPQKVADLYAPNAVLLPTVSSQIRTTRAQIIDYFAHFLKSKPQGRVTEQFISILDRNDALNTGLYTFTLTQNGVRQDVPARFTFVYERIRDKWLILNHHSSLVPEG